MITKSMTVEDWKKGTSVNGDDITTGSSANETWIPPAYTQIDPTIFTHFMNKESDSGVWTISLPSNAFKELHSRIQEVAEEFVKEKLLRKDVIIKEVDLTIGPVTIKCSPALDEMRK